MHIFSHIPTPHPSGVSTKGYSLSKTCTPSGGLCCCCCCGRRYGNYLVVLYFFVKTLYLVNLIFQMFLMEKFIGTNYTFFGLGVLSDLLQGRQWFHSGNFPRVTFCDFEAKKLGKNLK
ncbi:unnamed protein product [Protopolystoma xenopodis]|uniref:Innexin n=1 Tax=Protopolystoma xenopodis TaxID=117903 RepID=A0A448X050_9PLAT|nr:unnamed protein product [Protopolystoma xenopodis]